jgi:predicted  nucleic acid-binding Zn-ribbon protein
MEQRGLHRGLELRLEALAARIAALRSAMSRAKGEEKLADAGEVAELEQRHQRLAERLSALDGEGPGFRHNVKAEVEKMADDLSGVVEDFTLWVDSGYCGAKPSLRGRRP